MSKFFRHWGLVNRHRFRVFRNGCHCGIGWHCLFHDLSKYTPKEFWTSVRYYVGDHSPVYEERLSNGYFSTICQAHTRRNKHHWEYWTDYFLGRIIAKTMPWKYATEYVCDMLAASYCYEPKTFSGQKCYQYFLARHEHFYFSDASREYISWCLQRFAELGFAGLKKKDTKAKYAEIVNRHPNPRVYDALALAGALPETR